jgi:hypothetical protein
MLFAVIRLDHPDGLAPRMSVRPKHLEYLQTVLLQIFRPVFEDGAWIAGGTGSRPACPATVAAR